MKKISKKDLELNQEKVSDLTVNASSENKAGDLNTFGTVCICATQDNCPNTKNCGKTTTGGYCCADTGSNCMEPYTIGHVCASHGCITNNTCGVATEDACVETIDTCIIQTAQCQSAKLCTETDD